jgi:uncharacterized protein (TIGR03067 family)
LAVPKITDFGLAKRLDDTSGQTQSGTIVGTPSYMAPEQASGHGGHVGPAADVYALGAILYELLTGRPPFKAATPLDTILQVIAEEPVPPRRLQPQVPRDLETICLKCLDKNPQRRYASAADLAEDLGHFLADEPIRARPTPAWERAWKWARRRPAVAGLLAVSTAAAVALLIVGGWYNVQLHRERDHAIAQQKEAERQQRRAQAVLRKAVEAVDRLTRVTPERFALLATQVSEERIERIRDAIQLCRDFLKLQGDDPAGRQQTGRSYNQLALLHLLLRNTDQVEKEAQRALAVQRQLVADFPDRPEYRYDLACSLLTQGHVCVLTRRPQSWDSYRRALALLEPLIREHPRAAQYQQTLAEAHRNLGILYMVNGRLAEAEKEFGQDRAVYERLARTHPDVPDYQGMLAVGHNNMAVIWNRTGRPEQARTALEKGIALYERLARKHPRIAQDFQPILAGSYLNLGVSYVRTGQKSLAETNLRKSLDLTEQLLREYPRAEDLAFNYFQGHLVLVNDVLNEQYQRLLPVSERGIDLMEKLLRHRPKNVQLKTYLATMLAVRAGDLLGKLGRHAAALKDWDRALQLGPARLDTILHTGRAITLAHQGHHRRALAEARSLPAAKLAAPHAQSALANLHAVVAAVVLRDARLSPAERSRQAEDNAHQAVALLVKLQQAGFFRKPSRVTELQTDKDLDALRGRADFQKLLANLAELEKLRGTWEIVSAEHAGRPDETSVKVRVTWNGDEFVVKKGDQVLGRGTAQLDPSAHPGAIDDRFTPTREVEKREQGIYALEGDTLRICYAAQGKERPHEFTTRSGSGALLFIFRRVKP